MFGTTAIATGAGIIMRARKEARAVKIPRAAFNVLVGATSAIVLGITAGTIHLAYEFRELNKDIAALDKDIAALREARVASTASRAANNR